MELENHAYNKFLFCNQYNTGNFSATNQSFCCIVSIVAFLAFNMSDNVQQKVVVTLEVVPSEAKPESWDVYEYDSDDSAGSVIECRRCSHPVFTTYANRERGIYRDC